VSKGLQKKLYVSGFGLQVTSY